MQKPLYAKPTGQNEAPAMSSVGATTGRTGTGDGGKGKTGQPAAFSFSCLVLNKYAAAAETLSTTPLNHSKRTSAPPSVAPPTQDDSRQPPEEEPAPVATSATAAPPQPPPAKATRSISRRIGLRKALRQQEVATVAETPAAEPTAPVAAATVDAPETREEPPPQPYPWETTTKAIQLEALRALQCCPLRADDEMTLQTGGGETNVSMQGVFPDDLSDYEMGTVAGGQPSKGSAPSKDSKASQKDGQAADAAASSTLDVSPDDLKELVQAASSTVDSLERKLSTCRWVSICLFLLLVVAAALLIVLGVGGFGGLTTQESEVNDNDHGGSSPTMAPTLSLESTLDALKNEYLPSDTLEALTDPSSPQSKAWKWLEWEAGQRLLNETAASTLQPDALLTRFALATFYHATLGDSWTTDTAWLSIKSECEWYSGVPEPCPNGTFSVLSLPQNNVTGSIPREVELLTQLSRIDLSINPLVTLPESFAAMEALVRLDLQQLSLMEVPELPPKLGHLDLRSNSLTGVPLEIANMTTLQTLLLGVNPFESQSVPSFLTSLVNLTYLSLEDCQLSGTVPSSLAQLTQLEYLILEDNRFVGSIPSQLSLLSNLKLMTLHQNLLTGSVPQAVCSLKQNTSMFLSVDCDAVQCDCGCGCGL